MERRHARDVMVEFDIDFRRVFTVRGFLQVFKDRTSPGEPLEGWLDRLASTRKATDFLGSSNTDEIGDPHGESRRAHRRTFDMLERCALGFGRSACFVDPRQRMNSGTHREAAASVGEEEPSRHDRSTASIVVVAYECGPQRGSESGAGFNLVQALSERYRCTVLVGDADADSLRAWADEHPERDLVVRHVKESSLGRRLYAGHHYTQFMSYLLWQRRVRSVLEQECRSGSHRAAWHATYSPFWLPTPLRFVRTIPTIWGPLTGADRTPRPLRGLLGRKGRIRDTIDQLATSVFVWLPSTRASHRLVDWVLVSLPTPMSTRLRPHDQESFIQCSLVNEAPRPDSGVVEDCVYFTSPLRTQKGPLLAIRAAAKSENSRLVVCAPPHGPLEAEAKALVRELGVEERVTFLDNVPRDEMLNRISQSKGIVHTAVADSASMALAEALALGVPVVALDVPGSASLLKSAPPEFARLVDVRSVAQVIDDLATEISSLCALKTRPGRSMIDSRLLVERLHSTVDRAQEAFERKQHPRVEPGGREMQVAKTAGPASSGSVGSHDPAPASKGTVVQFLYRVADRGGESVAHTLAAGFRRSGYAVKNVGAYRSAPISSHTADFEVLFPARPSLFGNIQCFVRIVRMLRRDKPIAVLMHGDVGQLVGGPAAALAGVKHRIAINHLALGIFVRWVRYAHVAWGLLGAYEEVVFVGESARRDADGLPKRFLRRCHVIANAVPAPLGDRDATRKRYGIEPDEVLLLNVGSMQEQKNQLILLQAMAAIDTGCLIVVGDGHLRHELETAAARLGRRVRFTGRIDPHEVGNLYAAADVFVFPSRFEGRPLALLEAALAGLPLIASPIPENIEVSVEAAHYVGVDDLDGWIAALRKATTDAGFRQALKTKTYALDVGTDDAMVEQYLDLMK